MSRKGAEQDRSRTQQAQPPDEPDGNVLSMSTEPTGPELGSEGADKPVLKKQPLEARSMFTQVQ